MECMLLLGVIQHCIFIRSENNMTVFDGNIDSRIYILAHFAFGSLNGNHCLLYTSLLFSSFFLISNGFLSTLTSTGVVLRTLASYRETDTVTYTTVAVSYTHLDNAKVGKLLHVPERADIPENIKEHLIVELYSK